MFFHGTSDLILQREDEDDFLHSSFPSQSRHEFLPGVNAANQDLFDIAVRLGR